MTMKLPTQPSMSDVKITQFIQMYYGPPGVGKTTFVNGLGEKVLFLSTDRGTRTVNTMRIECDSWEDIAETCDALIAPGAVKYDVVCVDHVADMANMAEQFVLEKLGVESFGEAAYGKAWKAYKHSLFVVVNALKSIDTGLAFIAHETIKTVKSRSVELQRTMPDISKLAWNAIVPICDLVGYCGFTTVKTEDGKRKEVRSIVTQPREDLYAKDRTNRNKPEGVELLDPAAFLETFNNGSSRQEEEEARPRGRRARG